MKKFVIIISSLALVIVSFIRCDDPYENTTYQAYDMNPASTYMSSREDLSEFVAMLRYTDLYNAINQAYSSFTVFVPNNEAMQKFYESRGVSSLEELGVDYASSFIKYHVLSDSITYSTFVSGGELSVATLSEEYLTVTFGDSTDVNGSGLNAVYLNGEAHVIEMDIRVSNGFVYILEDALTPVVESLWEKLNEETESNYSIMKEALSATGWGDTLNIIKDTLSIYQGIVNERTRTFTLLGVTDETFAAEGINSLSDLVSELGAGSDYTNAENALNRYVAYHILDGSYSLERLKMADTDTIYAYNVYSTYASGTIIKMTKEADGDTYLNYDNDGGAQFVEKFCDVRGKNGYIQQISSYLPIWEDPTPAMIWFDFCDYSEVENYIASNGTEGQKYQTVDASNEYRTDVSSLSCYSYQIVNYPASTSSYNYLDYMTAKSTNNFSNCRNGDMLVINLGYMSWVSMQTPTIIQGRYKVTLRFCYATSQNFMRQATDGSNGGQMQFSFDDEHIISATPYTSVPSNSLNVYDYVLYDELEFETTSDHTFKILVQDPAASTNSSFRIQLDYLLFEPLN